VAAYSHSKWRNRLWGK